MDPVDAVDVAHEHLDFLVEAAAVGRLVSVGSRGHVDCNKDTESIFGGFIFNYMQLEQIYEDMNKGMNPLKRWQQIF